MEICNPSICANTVS